MFWKYIFLHRHDKSIAKHRGSTLIILKNNIYLMAHQWWAVMSLLRALPHATAKIYKILEMKSQLGEEEVDQLWL
jgi:hypothetical protein